MRYTLPGHIHPLKSGIIVMILAFVLAACGPSNDGEQQELPTLMSRDDQAVAVLETPLILPTLVPFPTLEDAQTSEQLQQEQTQTVTQAPESAPQAVPPFVNPESLAEAEATAEAGIPPQFDGQAVAQPPAFPQGSVPPDFPGDGGSFDGQGSAGDPFTSTNNPGSPDNSGAPDNQSALEGPGTPSNADLPPEILAAIEAGQNGSGGGSQFGDASQFPFDAGDSSGGSGSLPFDPSTGPGSDSSLPFGSSFGNSGSRFFVDGDQPITVFSCWKPAECDVLGTLEAGSSVTISEEDDGAGEWTAIVYEGETAYVYSAFIAEREQTVSDDPFGGGQNGPPGMFDGGGPGSDMPDFMSNNGPGGNSSPFGGGGEFPTVRGFGGLDQNPLYTTPSNTPNGDTPDFGDNDGTYTGDCPPFLDSC